MHRTYLDHASSSPLRKEAIDAMSKSFEIVGADPGRLHQEGMTVRDVLERARDQVAQLVGVRSRQVIFTSSGSEAVNAAIWSATRDSPEAPVLSSMVEHSCVLEASNRLAKIEVIEVDQYGRIDPDFVKEQLLHHDRPSPALVHCQWANHEVGTLQPVSEMVKACREAQVPIHIDAAGACGVVPLNLNDLEADFVSISSHTFGGPPGVGALILRRGLRLNPFIVGGQQERARRAGMENIIGIIGMGAAAAALGTPGSSSTPGTPGTPGVPGSPDTNQMAREISKSRDCIEYLVQDATTIPGVRIIGDPDPFMRLPNLICLAIDGVQAEAVLLGLDRAGIAVHSGSACSSESFEPSKVLEAMGEDGNQALRVSVGWTTTKEEIDSFNITFKNVVSSLRELGKDAMLA